MDEEYFRIEIYSDEKEYGFDYGTLEELLEGVRYIYDGKENEDDILDTIKVWAATAKEEDELNLYDIYIFKLRNSIIEE